MSSYAFSSDRPLRVVLSAQNPEFKSHITDLVSRAYFNLHNAPISATEPNWANAIIASAVHICMDERVQRRTTRELIHLFEDIIRVSEEHLREAKRHASMASNAFYLRETVLDNLLSNHQPEITTSTTIVRIDSSDISRLRQSKDS